MDLIIGAKIIKLLEENIGENICDIGVGKDVLKTQKARRKIIKWTLFNL